MKKRIFSLLLAAFMILSMSVSVFAEDMLSDGWYVNFTGENPLDSNITAEEMMEDASNMQPGDNITFEIQVMNSKEEGQAVNYYLKNDIIKSFEEGAAKGAAYAYRLAYTTADGEERVFYDNSSVGGTVENVESEEGLESADANLDEFFFLDSLDYNEAGTLELYIELDGETQGNDYQNTMAQILLQFQVEEVEEKADDIVVTQTKQAEDKTVYTTKSVNTGDPTQSLPYIIGLGAAGIVILIIAIILVKRRKKESENIN